jgi:CubicO group peptidase (beta-lactamase class C family)
MSLFKGYFDPRFGAVSQLLHDYLSSGEEVGASLAVNIDGEDVVNIWGGHKDVRESEPWQQDTIVNVMSCSKLVTNLAALILVDRGILDLNAKVSKYWPEFAVEGKHDIEVRHVLSHTAGLPGWDQPMTLEDLYDWDNATSALARQAPWWKPGTRSGYHAITQGFLVGVLVRRTTGKTLREFVRTEITGPLDADFQYGVKDQDLSRVSDVIPFSVSADVPAPDPSSVPGRVLTNPAIDFKYANSEGWRRAELGASNGHSNAAGMLRIMSVLTLGGKANGHRMLSPKTVGLIFQEQAKGHDAVVELPFRFGIGYGLAAKENRSRLVTRRTYLFLGRNRRVDCDHGLGQTYDYLIRYEQDE